MYCRYLRKEAGGWDGDAMLGMKNLSFFECGLRRDGMGWDGEEDASRNRNSIWKLLPPPNSMRERSIEGNFISLYTVAYIAAFNNA